MRYERAEGRISALLHTLPDRNYDRSKRRTKILFFKIVDLLQLALYLVT